MMTERTRLKVEVEIIVEHPDGTNPYSVLDEANYEFSLNPEDGKVLDTQLRGYSIIDTTWGGDPEDAHLFEDDEDAENEDG